MNMRATLSSVTAISSSPALKARLFAVTAPFVSAVRRIGRRSEAGRDFLSCPSRLCGAALRNASRRAETIQERPVSAFRRGQPTNRLSVRAPVQLCGAPRHPAFKLPRRQLDGLTEVHETCEEGREKYEGKVK